VAIASCYTETKVDKRIPYSGWTDLIWHNLINCNDVILEKYTEAHIMHKSIVILTWNTKILRLEVSPCILAVSRFWILEFEHRFLLCVYKQHQSLCIWPWPGERRMSVKISFSGNKKSTKSYIGHHDFQNKGHICSVLELYTKQCYTSYLIWNPNSWGAERLKQVRTT
jgi:hypothetical protein